MKKIFKDHRLPIIITVVLLLLIVVGSVFLICRINMVKERDKIVDMLISHTGEYDKNSIMLNNTNKYEAEALAKKYGADLRMSVNEKFAVLKLPDDKTVLDIYQNDDNISDISKFSVDWHMKLADVEYIEEDDTPKYKTSRPKYDVTDSLYPYQTYLDYINMQDVWNVTKGEGITVAVIDSGLDYQHSEFKGRISEWSYYVTDDKIVKDYLTDENDPLSYDYSIIDDQPWAKGGHGTFVTGVIAAAMDGEGITGIAPEVNIIVIKCKTDITGTLNTSDAIFGIYYAIERGADVINMSFGSCCPYEEDSFKIPLKHAVDDDVICVAAAGNCSTSQWCFPAANENCIGVGALAEDSYVLAGYSNYGINSDIVAPGTTLTTCISGYQIVDGTSLSCPVATGVIALYLSQHKYEYLEYSDVKEAVMVSSMDIGDPGDDFFYGCGCIDVSALVLEEKGKVTFDYLTDEIKKSKQTFVRNHTLQLLPEPERDYAVFEGWYYDEHCLDEVDYYVDVFTADLTLYAKWINEDDGIPYEYNVLQDDTVEITSYTGHRRYLTIPDYIEGRKVTVIGDAAFMGNTRLRHVNLPKYLKIIGVSAFRGCTSLYGIEIPDGVQSIGMEAFADDIRLRSVSFGSDSDLSVISAKAFKNCTSLTEFYIPKKVYTVSGFSFLGCTELTEYKTDRDSLYLRTDEGVLFNSSKFLLIAYPAGRGGEYTIPEMTRIIDDGAFAYSSITQIDLSNIEYIGDDSFYYTPITSLTIPDSVTFLGKRAFMNNSLSSLKLGRGLSIIPPGCFSTVSSIGVDELFIPNNISGILKEAFCGLGIAKLTFEDGTQLTEIGQKAFNNERITELYLPDSIMYIREAGFGNCNFLSDVHISDKSKLISIGDAAFTNSFALESIDLPESLMEIGESAFLASGLKDEVFIPKNVRSIGAFAFGWSFDLNDIRVDPENKYYKDINGVLFSKDGKTLIEFACGRKEENYIVPEGVITIFKSAFMSSAYLQSVEFPDTLKYIEKEAFGGVNGLFGIDIPDSVVKIGQSAFQGDANLHFINIGPDSNLVDLSSYSFSGCGIYNFNVPPKVCRIGMGVFSDCNELSNITFCSNSNLDIIPAFAFADCDNLSMIVFENGSALTTLRAHAFDGMKSLCRIDFGDADLMDIGNFAFANCPSLEVFTVPESTARIGRYAFYQCANLKEVYIPSSVNFIGRYAFLGAEDCRAYFAYETLPEVLQEDWDYGLSGYSTGVLEITENDDWKYAEISDGSIILIEYKGNDKNIDLTALDLGGNISQIGGECFSGSGIESVKLPETLKIIQRKAFYGTHIKSMHIPASVTFIGNRAFAGTDIYSLSFGEGSNLKNIEYSAFEKTANLKTVTLPASLESMGRDVFFKSGLESVVFEDGIKLTEIPGGAFSDTDLKSVVIPYSVSVISDSAFRDDLKLTTVVFPQNEDIKVLANSFYNTGLVSLEIPENMTYIGEYAFVGLEGLSEYKVSENNPYYKSVDGVLFHRITNKLIAFPAGRGGAYIVPSYTESIGFGAFESTDLSDIEFEEGINLLTIGYRAFFKARKLTKITIPASVVSVDYYAFAYADNLQKVVFADGNKLSGIYEGAFYSCTSLFDIELPDTVVEISDYAFYNCRSLVRLPVSDTSGLLAVYDHAFAYTGITNDLVLPDTIVDIGEYAFEGIKATTVTVPDNNQKDMIIGIGAFSRCSDLREITLPFIGGTFDAVDKYSWFGYIFGAPNPEIDNEFIPDNLTYIKITGDITTIAPKAFNHVVRGMMRNVYLELPDTVCRIYDDAFRFGDPETCVVYELKSPVTVYRFLEFEDDVPAEEVNGECFGHGITGKLILNPGVKTINCISGSVTELVLPEGVEVINSCSVSENIYINTVIKKINIPSTVKYIGPDPFCRFIEELKIEGDDPLFSIENGVLYQNEPVRILGFFPKMSNDTVILRSGITEIAENLFHDCDSIKKLVIPEGVRSIGRKAFAGCTALEEIIIPEGVESIGGEAFTFCKSLKTIDIPDSVTSIGWSAFGNIEAIKAVVIPDSVTDLSGAAFINCTGLETVELGIGISKIPEDTFNGCKNLSEIICARDIESIEERAFYLCSKLSSFVFPDTLKTIGNNAFYGCMNLKSIVLNEGLKSIEANAFDNCKRLFELTIPSTVEVIGDNAFGACGIYEVTNLSDLPLTFEHREYGLGNIQKITDKNGAVHYESDGAYLVETIVDENGFVFEVREDDYCLSDYIGDEDTVRLPESCYGHDFRVYMTRCNAKTLIIPGSFYETGLYPIEDLYTSFENIILEDGIKMISDYAFRGNRLREIEIPDGVEIIGYSAFENCRQLEEIYIGKNVKEIGTNAFFGCTSLVKFEIDPENKDFCFENGVIYNADKTKLITVIPTLIPDKVIIPGTVESIPGYMFSRLPIKEVILGEGIRDIGASAFSGCNALVNIVMPTTVETIGFYAFSECAITEITIPDNVLRLEKREFLGCRDLKKITIGKNTEYIDTTVFAECPSISTVMISEQNTKLVFKDGLFCSSDETRITGSIPCMIKGKVVIQEGVREISNITFVDTDITEVVLPASLQIITKPIYFGVYDGYYYTGDDLFYRCDKLRSISINENNVYFSIFDGIMYDNPVTKIISVPHSLSSTVVIPEGVTEIEPYMFSEHNNIKKVVLPDSVTSIGSFAFFNCENLEEVVMTDNVTRIGEYAFTNSALRSIRIPVGITRIENSTFESCKNLFSVEFSPGLTEIGSYAFSGCSSLSDPVFPDSLTRIERSAFMDCPSFIRITLPESLQIIENEAFDMGAYTREGTILYELINNSKVNIDFNKNYGMTLLRSITDKNGTIYADGYEGFRFVDTSDGYCYFDENGKRYLVAYSGDKSEITLPEYIDGQTYELYCFRGPEKIIIENTFEELPAQVFFKYSPTKTIVIGKGVKYVDCGNFCEFVETVIFSDDIEHISSNVFANCPRLETVVLPDKVIDINTGALDHAYKKQDGAYYVGKILMAVDPDTEYFVPRPDTVCVAHEAFRWVSNIKMTVNTTIAPNPDIIVFCNQDLYDQTIYIPDGEEIPFKSIVISKGCRLLSSEPFLGVTGINIYVEALEKDCRWDETMPWWSKGNKVFYGDEWNWATFRDAEGKVISHIPVKNSEILRIPYLPLDTGDGYMYDIKGWDVDGDGECERVPALIYDDFDATVIAEKIKAEYRVRFFDSDRRTLLYEYISESNKPVVLPEIPQKRGYTFEGWRDYREFDVVNSDRSYFASWRHNGDGHEYIIQTIDPTCTEQGYDLHLCTICGESYKSDYTSPLGHEFGEWIVDHPATCTEEGMVAHSCHCGYTESESIPTIPHNYDRRVEKYPTCIETGIVLCKCVDCGFEYTEYTPVSTHNFAKKHLSPNEYDQLRSLDESFDFIIEVDEIYCFECSVCHRIKTDDDGDEVVYSMMPQSLGCSHISGLWRTEKEPTEEEIGTSVLRCSKCGDVLEIKIMPEKGHTFNEPEWRWSDSHTVAAAIFKCETCDFIKEIDAVVSVESNESKIIYTAVVEFNDNEYSNSKSIDNSFSVKFIDYNGTVLSEKTYHYGDTVTEPDQPSKPSDQTYYYVFTGWTPEITAVSGNAEYTAVFEARAHEWNEPTYEWSADHTSVTAKRASKNDGTITQTETAAATVNTTDAGCENDGKTTYTAIFVNTAFSKQTYEETIPASGHSFKFTDFTWNGNEAYANRKCDKCEKTDTVKADVAKAEKDGVITYTAKVTLDGTTYSDEKSEYIDYTVVFKDYDGTVLSENTYHYGDGVTVPDDPEREEDETYTYSFSGWDKEITEVKGNETYTATYEATEKPQTQFVPGDINGDGSVNNKDVVALFKYVSGGEIAVNDIALDINGDGSVNNKDVVALFKYVSGGEIELSDKPYNPNAKAMMFVIVPKRTGVR